jgi:purine-binding chemotaxis protein CheW
MFSNGPERLFVFGVGGERFAVSLSAVDEVVDVPPLRPLPDASSFVLGVTALGGALVTIYDPRPILGVQGTLDEAALMFVRDGRRIGVGVGALYDTIVVEPSDIRTAPGVGAADGVLLGVVRQGKELIAILDVDSLVDAMVVANEAQGERT